jgi:hypothetical protein
MFNNSWYRDMGALRRIWGPKRVQVTGVSRGLPNETHHNCSALQV